MSAIESTQSKIIRAARHIATSMPFETIQMQDIAVKAGISRATLYRYYTTKEQVYADLTLQWGIEFHQRLRQTPRQPKEKRKRLYWVIQSIVDEAESEKQLIRAFLICLLQGKTAANKELSEVSQLMPALLSLALNVDIKEVPVQVIRLLQHVLLSSLVSLQLGEVDYSTAIDDLKYAVDKLI